jgi:hypothetical protein
MTYGPQAPAGTELVLAPEPAVAVVETSMAAAAQMMKSAYETRLIMARQFPRTWEAVRTDLLAACQRPAFAEEARYRLERGGKKPVVIEGLTVRFAEEAARCMGNLLCEARVAFDDLDRRIVTVSVTDLERNLTYPFDVVVDKTVERSASHGREVVSVRNNAQNERVYRVRAYDDEVLMKQNSLVSKAVRNGILRFLPSDLQEQALAAVRQALTAAPLPEPKDIKRLVAGFKQVGVTLDELQGFLGHPVQTVTAEEYANLRSLWNAIKDGEATWAEAIESVPQTLRRTPPAVRDPQDDYDRSQ